MSAGGVVRRHGAVRGRRDRVVRGHGVTGRHGVTRSHRVSRGDRVRGRLDVVADVGFENEVCCIVLGGAGCLDLGLDVVGLELVADAREISRAALAVLEAVKDDGLRALGKSLDGANDVATCVLCRASHSEEAGDGQSRGDNLSGE